MSNELKNELIANCKSVAEELEGYAYGNLIYCEEEGGFIDKTDDVEDDGLGAWLSYVLDIRVTTDLSGNDLYGARVCVACGGPNIYVDTCEGCVEGYWGTEHVSVELSGSACEVINDLISEYRGC